MFKKLKRKILNWTNSNIPWTNVYGLARSIIAMSTALTLAFNDSYILFKPAAGIPEYPQCNGISNISIFCLFSNKYIYLEIIRWLCVILLVIIASGWRPCITGILHWWISYSFHASALTVDGGDQVAAVITLLLIPLMLTDPRKWHWQVMDKNILIWDQKTRYTSLLAFATSWVIRFQVAVLYLNSSVAKLKTSEWLDGTAVYYYIQQPMLGMPSILKDIFNPILTSSLVVIPTWGTLIVQFILFAAFFAPKKYWKHILIIAIFMHEIFAIMLGLISFSLIMLAVLILYLRPIEDSFNFRKLAFWRSKNKYFDNAKVS